jgi:hypothetical protein
MSYYQGPLFWFSLLSRLDFLLNFDSTFKLAGEWLGVLHQGRNTLHHNKFSYVVIKLSLDHCSIVDPMASGFSAKGGVGRCYQFFEVFM